MKLLTFSTLFPNEKQPGHGIFVETRLRELVASGQVSSRVVAPVPWFPSSHPRFGQYALYAGVPARERRHGLEIHHPRYVALPKVGMNVAPMLLAQGAKREIGRILDQGYDFDAIDAHYFYPDGVAAAMLGRYFNKPVVITARGSDVNLLPRYPLPRRMIQWAARQAKGIITVSNALKEGLVQLGVAPAAITPLRNGVDLEKFHPMNRDAVRAALGLRRFTLISVGHLVELKGHHLVIGALPRLPDTELLVAGSGPERARLEALARTLGVADRVRFLGAVPHAELAQYFNAADLMVLASSREGWANVLLESMACGTPVVASRVGGSPEVVAAPEAGILMGQYSSEGVAEAVQRLRERQPDRGAARRYAEGFSWDFTTRGQIDLFQKIIVEHAA
ncbi:glycosyltransferase family 4 protein [Massilia sp. ZL223]|uniref:glycosyltransferase family 4 protein n=1 Tax=Massilia sp. ZL223 TaxID=2824904 RepID=UPI001B83A5A7|nr:glycosyltransferase family 4 protein [Massilia sp. ZL223]MBQ5964516.1 glycosyltransferase family 4 protein [Massilia sp. ZL223]